MQAQPSYKVNKTSNFPEQKILSEVELLQHLERHYSGNPAARIYVAPRCYIKPEFYEFALRGMLISFETREQYEICGRIFTLLQSIEKEKRQLP